MITLVGEVRVAATRWESKVVIAITKQTLHTFECLDFFQWPLLYDRKCIITSKLTRIVSLHQKPPFSFLRRGLMLRSSAARDPPLPGMMFSPWKSWLPPLFIGWGNRAIIILLGGLSSSKKVQPPFLSRCPGWLRVQTLFLSHQPSLGIS